MVQKNHPFRDEFSNQSYNNPSSDRLKYKDRDPEVGLQEAQRRLTILPELETASLEYCIQNSIEPPTLLPKGSVVVNMCTPESDFDIAVMVKPRHYFTSNPKDWRRYQSMLETTCDVDYKVEPRLVVDNNHFSNNFF